MLLGGHAVGRRFAVKELVQPVIKLGAVHRVHSSFSGQVVPYEGTIPRWRSRFITSARARCSQVLTVPSGHPSASAMSS